MQDDELMTPHEAAARLKVHKETLEAWRAQRKGPKWIKLGESKRSPVRYRRSDIEAYLKTNTQI